MSSCLIPISSQNNKGTRQNGLSDGALPEFAMNGVYDPSDPFLRFIAIWITFNALYERNLPGERERRQIRAISERKDFRSFHAAVLAQSPDYERAIQLLASTGVSDVRTGKRRVINDATDLESVLLCVYQVRCNLFHGGKHREDERDRMLSTSGFVVISYLLTCTMSGNVPPSSFLSSFRNATARIGNVAPDG